MFRREKIVSVAAVSVCATAILPGILRRLASLVWDGTEPTPDDDGNVDYDREDDSGRLPELGWELQESEFSFSAGEYLLNNGSYGAVPNRVLRAQKRLMDERETCPSRWYRSLNFDFYRSAIKVVAEFVGARPENLVLVENATTATNSIVKSFKFQPGDQVLISSHTYKGVVMTLEWLTEHNPGVSLVQIDIPFQTTVNEIIAAYTKALDENPRIKMAIVDHITSPSAICMPIRELIDLCHSHDVIIAIDGAHCPGQLQLNLEKIGADFYVGNLHKWMFAPRGCSLLYVHPKHHSWIQTAISCNETFSDDLQKRFWDVGTRDNTPYFTAKHAIHFHNYLGGLDRITSYNRKLAYWAAEMLSAAWQTSWIQLEPALRSPFMCLVVLPQTPKLASYEGSKYKLMEDIRQFGVHVSVTTDGKRMYLRVSAQVYNYREEYYRIRDAVKKVLGF